jgi:hypothetical protein
VAQILGPPDSPQNKNKNIRKITFEDFSILKGLFYFAVLLVIFPMSGALTIDPFVVPVPVKFPFREITAVVIPIRKNVIPLATRGVFREIASVDISVWPFLLAVALAPEVLVATFVERPVVVAHHEAPGGNHFLYVEFSSP